MFGAALNFFQIFLSVTRGASLMFTPEFAETGSSSLSRKIGKTRWGTLPSRESLPTSRGPECVRQGTETTLANQFQVRCVCHFATSAFMIDDNKRNSFVLSLTRRLRC
jgi:hypothetical protein